SSHGRTGVVLVHGFVCNRGLWTPWMRVFRERGIPFVAVNLEPVFGSIDSYPQIIEAAVARIEAATSMPVVLVGHSMGGLAIRSWLTQQRADARVRRIVTIGSPHQGTWLARYSTTVNGTQMRPGSPWLTNLAAREPTSGRAGLFTCFYSDCDNIVFPERLGTIPGAVNLRLSGVAHMEMVFEASVIREVFGWLETSGDPVQIS
ncbi:MAG: alpha/beta fold hydrolase, partial [Burkholderiaceae bacterium]